MRWLSSFSRWIISDMKRDEFVAVVGAIRASEGAP
jgi:hypothetical protein